MSPPMSLEPGIYTFGPGNGTLSVRTGRTGAAARAGHDLLILATDWQATLEVGAGSAATSVAVRVDSTSLRVREGHGGMQELGGDEMAAIEQTIREEILTGEEITFRSTAVEISADGAGLGIEGELTLAGTTRPLSLQVTVGGGGRLGGSVVLRQSDWGITPYSTLFGTLKVTDDVEIAIDAALAGRDVGEAATPEWERPDDAGSRVAGFRVPAIDPRVSSAFWALVCFLVLWFDLVTLGVAQGTGLLFAFAASSFVYLLARRTGAGRDR